MVCQRYVAVGASWHPPADVALYHRGKATPVLKQDGLFATLQRLADGGKQVRREQLRHHFATPKVFHVHHFNGRQLNILVPLRQGNEPILAQLCVSVAFGRRCGSAQQRFCPIHLRKNNGCRACVVAWCRVLLLETRLVFFVDNHQSKPLERQEHGTSCTQYDIVGRAGKLLFPYFHTLVVVVSAMINAELVAKHTAQAVGHLHRQRNFG